jgi:hypothetical protein
MDMICDCGNEEYMLEMCRECFDKWVEMLDMEVKNKLEVDKNETMVTAINK